MSELARRVLLKWSATRPPWILATTGLVAMCVLLVATWATSTPIIDEIARIEGSRLPRLELLQAARDADLDAGVALRNVLLVKDPTLDSQELERYVAANKAAMTALNAFGAGASHPDEARPFGKTLAARQRLLAVRTEALRSEHQGVPIDFDAVTRSLSKAHSAYLAELRQLRDYQAERVMALVNDMAEREGRVRLLLAASGVTAAITMIALAMAWRAELRREVRERDLHIASLQSQKEALVGEVHHRIKNHLQGLLGLIETRKRAVRGVPEEQSLMTLHAHVLALIGIHGLQAREVGHAIALKSLVRQQVDLVRAGFPAARLALSEGSELEGAALPPDQAVPVALMVTELMVNAIKHGAQEPIRITMGVADGRTPYVAVANRLSAPTPLDWPGGRGLGTGLGLLSTLSEGIAEVAQATAPEELVMTLRLTHPLNAVGA